MNARLTQQYNDFSGIWDFVIQRTAALKIHDLQRKDVNNNHVAEDSILNFQKHPPGETQEVFCLVGYRARS